MAMDQQTPVTVEVHALIEQLQDLIEHSSMFPWPGRRAVSYDQFYRLTEEIKRRLPEELMRAAAVLENREQLLVESSAQAQDILEQAGRQAHEIRERANAQALSALEAAQQQIEKQLSREEIVRAAEARGTDIIRAAEEDAAQIRAGADQYAVAILQRLEAFLARVQHSVEEGKRSLMPPASQ